MKRYPSNNRGMSYFILKVKLFVKTDPYKCMQLLHKCDATCCNTNLISPIFWQKLKCYQGWQNFLYIESIWSICLKLCLHNVHIIGKLCTKFGGSRWNSFYFSYWKILGWHFFWVNHRGQGSVKIISDINERDKGWRWKQISTPKIRKSNFADEILPLNSTIHIYFNIYRYTNHLCTFEHFDVTKRLILNEVFWNFLPQISPWFVGGHFRKQDAQSFSPKVTERFTPEMNDMNLPNNNLRMCRWLSGSIAELFLMCT